MATITNITKTEQVVTTTDVTVNEVLIVGMEADINYLRPQRTRFLIDFQIGYRDAKGTFIVVNQGNHEFVGDNANSLFATQTKGVGTLWGETEQAVIDKLVSEGII